MRETTTAETRVCEALALLLADVPVSESYDDSTARQQLMSALESFIPEVLREIYNAWKGESFDGIFPALARRMGQREIEIAGACCLISDQTLTPFHVQLQLSTDGKQISWVDCRLGEHTANGMRREPYTSEKSWGTMLHVINRLDSIDWFYHAGYGER